MDLIARQIYGNKKQGALNAFVSTWNTENTSTGSSITKQIKLPLLSGGTYNFTVNWGDTSSSTITLYNQAEVTHTYASAGTYIITISGICTGWYFNSTGDRLKILSVQSWGGLKLTSTGRYFDGCSNLNLSSVSDSLDLSGVSSLLTMFRACSSLSTINNLNNWDTSNIISMDSIFQSCTNFNQELTFNTSLVQTFAQMFYNCTNFNNGLASGVVGTLNISTISALSTFRMFQGCASFNQILPFNMSAAVNIRSMFFNCTAFNQDIGSWNVSNVVQAQLFMGLKAAANYSAFNLDSIYNGWSSLPSLKPGVTLDFSTIKYTAAGVAGRAILTGTPNNWIINDGGI